MIRIGTRVCVAAPDEKGQHVALAQGDIHLVRAVLRRARAVGAEPIGEVTAVGDRHGAITFAVDHQRRDRTVTGTVRSPSRWITSAGTARPASSGRTSTDAARVHSAPAGPGEKVCRYIRAARSRYLALSRIRGALAPTITPSPTRGRRRWPAHRLGLASKPDSPGRFIFASPPASTWA